MIIIGLLVDLKNEKNSCICDKCVICKSFLICRVWFVFYGFVRVLIFIDVIVMELDFCGIIYVFIGDCIVWCNKYFMWI